MDRFRWEAEKEQRQGEYLKRHEYMATLFMESRLTLEWSARTASVLKVGTVAEDHPSP